MHPFQPTPVAFTGPSHLDESALREVLGSGLSGVTLGPDGSAAVTATLVDSADDRLRAADVDVVAVDRGPLVALQGAREYTTERPARWPALVADLPAGDLREIVRKPLGVRALVPRVTARTRGTRLAVRNEDDKIVVRLGVWSGTVPGRHRADAPAALPAWVQVLTLRGYEREARSVARALEAAGLVRAHASWCGLVRSAGGLDTDLPDRTVMLPDQVADRAVSEALLLYLDDIESNIAGTIVGVDTEHLHELRVAVRRTRSVLKLLGDVLPAQLVERARAEFAELGRLTTPTRDLDVYLLDMDGLARRVARPDDLAVFRGLVRTQHAAEHRRLVRALRAERLRDALSDWRDGLDRVLVAPSTNGRTAAELGAERVRHAFAKTAKRARAISAASSPAKVHALRKSAKELRYLLEVFAPISDPKRYKAVVSDVKKLQDVLGRFQDAEVQSIKLREFAQQLLDGPGRPSANAILTMGELAGSFDVEQVEARADLDAHHDRYLGKRTARDIERLVPTS